MRLRKQAFIGAKWTATSSALVAMLQFAQLAVLARLLQPVDFGLMALVVVVLQFFQTYADAGMSSAIVHRQDVTPEQLSSLFWLNALVGLAMCVALFLAAPYVAAAYGTPELQPLARLASCALLVLPISQQLSTLLQKDLRFGAMAAADLLSALSAAAVAVSLAWAGRGVESLVWGQLAGGAARIATLISLVFPRWRPSLRLQRGDLAGYLPFGLYQMAERTVNFLGANVDKLMIGGMLGTHALGLYNVAYQLVMRPVQIVNPVLTRVAFPLFAKVQDDNARLRAGYLDAIRIIAMLLFPLYMGIIVLVHPFTSVVLGSGWDAAAPTLQILCVLALFYALGNPLGSLLLAKGRVDLGLYLNVWRTGLFAVAIFLGVSGGPAGVAAALVVTIAVFVFPVGFWVRWLLVRMRPGEYFAAFVPALVAASIMALALLAVRAMAFQLPGALQELVVLAAVGAVVYLAIILPWQRSFCGRIAAAFR